MYSSFWQYTRDDARYLCGSWSSCYCYCGEFFSRIERKKRGCLWRRSWIARKWQNRQHRSALLSLFCFRCSKPSPRQVFSPPLSLQGNDILISSSYIKIYEVYSPCKADNTAMQTIQQQLIDRQTEKKTVISN